MPVRRTTDLKTYAREPAEEATHGLPLKAGPCKTAFAL